MLVWRLFLVSVCWWGSSSCQPGPTPVAIVRIVVNAPVHGALATADKDKLRAEIAEILASDRSVRLQLASKTSFIHPSSKPPRPYTLKVSWDDAAPEQMVVRLQPVWPHASEITAHTELSVASADRMGLLDSFQKAWHTVTKMRQLDRSATQRLVQSLRSPDPQIRDFAIDRLGERKARIGVKPLCKLIQQSEDPSVVSRIMGALIAIGDKRAVTPLIDLARKKDASLVSQVAFAVGAIGGRRAQAFLVVLASGHPDEIVQRNARDALDELMQRRPAARAFGNPGLRSTPSETKP